ncbi:hypothetical protein [Streptococcus merionis]|uniref:ABC transporter permease n=1 Tax=Streptococcus merionis TaxID=400065 RepID=A0A239ST34_9STRE|nr:hypothetical protein [Streptococcus merionis]SNU87803.1 ABC transporter permease [Streptococcus merionis]
MFGKLLKQEFKSVGKWYLSLYAMTMSFAVILGFWLKHMNQANIDESNSLWPMMLTMIIFLGFGAIIAALALSTLVLIIRRFKNNIYGRQGYLTMTLPATTHQILLSKLVAAVIWYVLSFLTVILAIFTIILITIGYAELREGFRQLLTDQTFIDVMKQIWGQLGGLNIVAYCVSATIGTINNIIMLYLAIALGHLAESHRILLSFVAFFVLDMFLMVVIMIVLNNTGISSHYYWFTAGFDLVLSLLMYFSTHYLIKHKLNIQ